MLLLCSHLSIENGILSTKSAFYSQIPVHFEDKRIRLIEFMFDRTTTTTKIKVARPQKSIVWLYIYIFSSIFIVATAAMAAVVQFVASLDQK